MMDRMWSPGAHRLLGSLTAAIVVAGCQIQVDFTGTRYACAEDGLCPPGFACLDGWCVVPGDAGEPPDAPEIDGAPDAPPDDAAPDAPPTRSTEGLVALYAFDDGSGAVAADTSGVAPPLPLAIADPGATSWIQGALVISAPTILSSADPADKIRTACQASGALTVEAWIRPMPEATSTYLVYAGSGSAVSVMIGTSADSSYYRARIRTSETDDNGNPELRTPAGGGDIQAEMTHLALVRDAAGLERLYVNGVPRAAQVVGGDHSTWDPTYRLHVADRTSGSRGWLGELHLLAIFCRALPEAEVVLHRDLGPG
jgi:hypothetical protein